MSAVASSPLLNVWWPTSIFTALCSLFHPRKNNLSATAVRRKEKTNKQKKPTYSLWHTERPTPLSGRRSRRRSSRSGPSCFCLHGRRRKRLSASRQRKKKNLYMHHELESFSRIHGMRAWGCQGQTCESIPLNSRFHNTA